MRTGSSGEKSFTSRSPYMSLGGARVPHYLSVSNFTTRAPINGKCKGIPQVGKIQTKDNSQYYYPSIPVSDCIVKFEQFCKDLPIYTDCAGESLFERKKRIDEVCRDAWKDMFHQCKDKTEVIGCERMDYKYRPTLYEPPLKDSTRNSDLPTSPPSENEIAMDTKYNKDECLSSCKRVHSSEISTKDRIRGTRMPYPCKRANSLKISKGCLATFPPPSSKMWFSSNTKSVLPHSKSRYTVNALPHTIAPTWSGMSLYPQISTKQECNAFSSVMKHTCPCDFSPTPRASLEGVAIKTINLCAGLNTFNTWLKYGEGICSEKQGGNQYIYFYATPSVINSSLKIITTYWWVFGNNDPYHGRGETLYYGVNDECDQTIEGGNSVVFEAHPDIVIVNGDKVDVIVISLYQNVDYPWMFGYATSISRVKFGDPDGVPIIKCT